MPTGDRASPGSDATGLKPLVGIGRLGLSLLARLRDIVVPTACLACNEPISSADSLCAGCWTGIRFIRPPLCDRLGIPLPFDIGGTQISARAAAEEPDFDRCRAVAEYDGVMRQLVHGFKYSDRHELLDLFLRWLGETGGELVADADLIVPVPLSRRRLLSRRFNQAAELTAGLSKRSGLVNAPLLLRRIKKTMPQVGLTRAQRRANVAGAFAIEPAYASWVRDRRILLVDDVATTGATVNACARSLKRGGARHVDVLTLALVAHPSDHAD